MRVCVCVIVIIIIIVYTMSYMSIVCVILFTNCTSQDLFFK